MTSVAEVQAQYERNIKAKKDLDAGCSIYVLVQIYHIGYRTLLRFRDEEGYFEETQAKLVKRMQHYQSLIDDFTSGIPVPHIAKKYGFCSQTIYDKLERLGLTSDKGGVTVRTKKLQQKIVKYHKQGKTIREMATLLNLHKTTVANIIRELGLKPNKRTLKVDKVLNKKVISMYFRGYTQRDIAKELNTYRGKVAMILEQAKVTRGTKTKKYLDRDTKIVTLRKQGKSIQELMEIFNLSMSSIRGIIKDTKLID